MIDFEKEFKQLTIINNRIFLNAKEYGRQEGKAEAIKIIKRYSKFHIPKAIGDEMIKELKEQTQEVEND